LDQGFYPDCGSKLFSVSGISNPFTGRGAANATFFLGFDLGIGIGSIIWGIVAEALGYGSVYLWAMLPVLAAIFLYLKKAE
jgi:predicted MFS family arabinose efflux permease